MQRKTLIASRHLSKIFDSVQPENLPCLDSLTVNDPAAALTSLPALKTPMLPKSSESTCARFDGLVFATDAG